jgi:hypothetical protein
LVLAPHIALAHVQEVSKAINKRNEQRAATLAQRSSHSHLLKQKVIEAVYMHRLGWSYVCATAVGVNGRLISHLMLLFPQDLKAKGDDEAK